MIRELAELMAGLQAPYSLGGRIALGEGGHAWLTLARRLGMHGWMTADEVEPLVRDAIGQLVADALRFHSTTKGEA